MNKIQKEIFNIGVDVSEAISETDIKLIPGCGTLLGAARHNGIIPGDDDMDFIVVDNDFEKIIDVLKEKLSSKYVLSTLETDAVKHSIIQVIDTSIYEPMIKSSKKMYHHPFIDILNFVTVDKPKNNVFMNRLGSEINGAKNVAVSSSGGTVFVKPFIGFFPQKFLYRKIRTRASKIMVKNGKYLYEFSSAYYKTFRRELFGESITVKFENRVMEIPKKYDEILSIHYGDWRKTPSDLDERKHSVH